MWTYLLLLVLVFGGALVSGDTAEECQGRMRRCPVNISFPESRRELREVCPAVITHLECMQSYVENCIGDDAEIKAIRRGVSTAREVCREDSPLHAAIGDNLKCIKGTLNPESQIHCDAVTNNQSQIYFEHLTITDEEDEEVIYANIRKHRCLRGYLNTACSLQNILEKCGSVAKEAILEVFGRIRTFEAFCSPDDLSHFMEVIPQLDMNDEEKANILELLQLK